MLFSGVGEGVGSIYKIGGKGTDIREKGGTFTLKKRNRLEELLLGNEGEKKRKGGDRCYGDFSFS